jgi:anti-sigma-K factor RskA
MAADPHELVAPYALHALEDDEERTFEQHLAMCERCRAELAGLREAAASLAYGAAGPAPPAGLKERILAQARSERENVVPFERRRRGWTAPLAAAAAIAASVAVGLGVWAATRPAEDPFAAVLSKPGATVVPMGDRGAVAVARDGDAALALSVPPAPAGKTYEAWVIRGGRARAAGLFRGRDGTTTVELDRPVRSGSVVAVTLERAGGTQQPTREPLARSGAVS